MSAGAREMLDQAIKDKSDEEIMLLVQNMGGTENLLEMTFQGMEERLDPDKAQDCVVGWRLVDGAKTYSYAVTIRDKQASHEEREPTDARVTLGASIPDYLRLIVGQLDGMAAFMAGKLKLDGDVMFAQQIPQMFGIGA